jgi:Phosphatidylserine/phosphatidylglycerophosphate/cardiolipin synthases and related enzymes
VTAHLITALWVLGAVVATTLVWFIYLTLAVNAAANLEDLVNAAPPIGADPSIFLRSLHGSAGQMPTTGNLVEILVNGDAIFPAMIEAIRQSTETVHFATYVWWDGKKIPGEFADVFCETAKRGVGVRIVIDSEGSESMSRDLVKKMRDAGCKVEFFRGLHWNTWMRYNQRSHRRLLIVDGKVAFTGGVGIADEWSGNAGGPKHWRDTHAKVRGPAVASLQAAFADNWNKASSQLLLNARDYPPLDNEGSMEATVVVSTPTSGSSAAQRTMAS